MGIFCLGNLGTGYCQRSHRRSRARPLAPHKRWTDNRQADSRLKGGSRTQPPLRRRACLLVAPLSLRVDPGQAHATATTPGTLDFALLAAEV
jgi:hypothetical protein